MKYTLTKEEDKQRVIAVITGLNLEHPKQVEVGEFVPKHNREQEKLWHAMLGDIAKAFMDKNLGYTQADVKSIVKYKLGLYKELTGKNGTIISYEATHGRSKTFYTDLIESTYVLASEWNIYLE